MEIIVVSFVLESEKETEFGMNLVVVTDIKQSEKPTAKRILRMQNYYLDVNSK